MTDTLIAAEKISIYRAIDYRLGHTDQDILLSPGLRCARLPALFASKGVNCGGFITAYNPRGTQQSDADNDRDHALLSALLTERGFELIEGSAGEPGSDCPLEKSFSVLGMPRDAAMDIGRLFDQDAIVWVCESAVPELVLLR